LIRVRIDLRIRRACGPETHQPALFKRAISHSATRWQRSSTHRDARASRSFTKASIPISSAQLEATFRIPVPRTLTRRDEDHVARNLEPYRGFHVFMRSPPETLRRRKRAQIVIAGADGVTADATAA
jgi:hypothetical protein